MASHELHSCDREQLALGLDRVLELIEPASLRSVRSCEACAQSRQLLFELLYPRSNYLFIVADRLHTTNLLQ